MILYQYTAQVVRVVDGDTIDVVLDLGFHIFIEMKLRLFGINTPELKEQSGKVARDRLKEKIDGKQITVYTIKDKQEKYGRYLAKINCAGEDINEWLVSEGLAVRYMVG
jgi:micrococcal nuclease